jgi:hypothetical protein
VSKRAKHHAEARVVVASRTGRGPIRRAATLVPTTHEPDGWRAASALPFPPVTVAQNQDGTILLIERWTGLPADEPRTLADTNAEVQL